MPRTVEELRETLLEAKSRKMKVFVLGGGTNLLVNDDGFDGLVVKPELQFLSVSGTTLYAGAGVSMDKLLDFCVKHGFEGLEWAGGLPGILGGAVRGNAGAFGGEIKDIVQSVECLDTINLQEKKFENRKCKFSYRSSMFKDQGGRYIIVAATLALVPGDRRAIRAVISQKIAYRLKRHPLHYPNNGSMFKNVDARTVAPRVLQKFAKVIKNDPFPVIPAAYLISECKLSGISFGGAMISPTHPNFVVNVLDAKAEDVKNLMALMKNEVKRKFNIELEEEVMLV